MDPLEPFIVTAGHFFFHGKCKRTFIREGDFKGKIWYAILIRADGTY